ncbi:Major facilitator superfamily domain-containing protein 6 [Chionoecetes opilio]|uniref:Major facilitator superfamily domain-containing protein 6 n=1 Tax=Chionoecetes opilio TaxID=41210 RepID=A0A8J5CIM2_CHIOP|nr:Major facilitator superfamily domain-containing protein 6 [Chionoecetes opilio]
MKINKTLLPIKAHYFSFLGCMSPIIPFLAVVALQLGIPVAVIGSMVAASMLMVVVMKPFLAVLADTFPSYRRTIFLMTLVVMVVSFSSLNFVTPMKGLPRVQGQLRRVQETAVPPTTTPVSIEVHDQEVSIKGEDQEDGEGDGTTLLLAAMEGEGGECYVAVAWDCVALCEEPWSCFNTSTATIPASASSSSFSSLSVTVTLLSHHPGLQFTKGGEQEPLLPFSSAQEGEWHQPPRVYRLEGLGVSEDMVPGNLSLECGSGRWEGPRCLGVWHHWQFWMFTLLLVTGTFAFNTAVSVTDAIIVDTIGKDGDYGIQRAWGTVGWGLMGPVSGLLVDWVSGSNHTKNYMPAFLICLVVGSTDVIISAATIKVPKMTSEHNVLKAVWPIIRQPRFFVFCIFAVFNGAFDGVVANYLFMMQEQMAKGTSIMNHMKFLQGMTIFVQCGIEAPFMFINHWFMRTMGAHFVTSLVFFLYIFRLLGLAVVGAYGPVWATLLVELLNGPCYGLGYTAIVVYSSKLSPPGTSTTVQSIVNICYEILGYASASFFGGLLYSSFGGPGLYLVAGITSVIIFILHLLSLKLLPPPEGIGCHIHDGCINSLSCADDMVLLAPTADALQDLINVCQVYAAKHDVVYNTTKTECMVVSPARAQVNYLKTAWLSGSALTFVDRFAYLGHVISHDMTDDDDIIKQTTKLLVVGNTLQRKFSYCSREVKMELFRSHCYSIYCNSLWSRYKVATMNRLKVCHNDILKRLLGLPRWCSSSLAFARNGVNNLDVIRRNSVFSLRKHTEETKSLENQRVGEEEKLSPDPVTEELDESSALAVRVEGEQEAVEMN